MGIYELKFALANNVAVYQNTSIHHLNLLLTHKRAHKQKNDSKVIKSISVMLKLSICIFVCYSTCNEDHVVSQF